MDCATPSGDDSTNPDPAGETRKDMFARFRSGETKILCNVGVLTTGVDLDVRCIIDAQPTKSRILFVQKIGRGLRTAEGKDKCIILDHGGNHLRLGRVTDTHQDYLDDGKDREGSAKKAATVPLQKLCPECKAVLTYKARECSACGAQIVAVTTVHEADGELVELGSRRTGARGLARREGGILPRAEMGSGPQGPQVGLVLASISGAVPGRTPAEVVRAADAARAVHLNAKLVEIASHRLCQTEGRVMAKDPRKRGSIEGAFAWRLIEMLESPAYRVLTLSAHRAMARLEIEMAHHGGKPEENGRLPCTFEHFVEFGVERHAIAPAIRELVALGFVQITRKGCAGNAGFRQPALYRLTYRHCGSHKETTDEWKRIKTMEEAEAIAKSARAPQSERRQKNKNPVRETPPIPVRENPPIALRPQCGKTHYGPSGETHTTSISPGVGPARYG